MYGSSTITDRISWEFHGIFPDQIETSGHQDFFWPLLDDRNREDLPGLVNIRKRMEKWKDPPFFIGKSPFLMGKSSFLLGESPFLIGKTTISMGHFRYVTNYQRVSNIKTLRPNGPKWSEALYLCNLHHR